MVSFSGTGRRVSSPPVTSTDMQSEEYGDLSSARSCVGRVHPGFFLFPFPCIVTMCFSL